MQERGTADPALERRPDRLLPRGRGGEVSNRDNYNREDDHDYGDELGRRQEPAQYEASISVTAIELEDEPRAGVQQRVRGDHVAVHMLAPAEPYQEPEQRQTHGRFVELDGVEWHAERCAADRRSVGISERHSPGHRCGTAVDRKSTRLN